MAEAFTDTARRLLLHDRIFQISVGSAVYFTFAAIYFAISRG